MKKDTISIEMASNMANVKEMSNECYEIFDKHGGYSRNDEMICQLQGLRESTGECLNEEDWENMVTEAKTTHVWFCWVKTIKLLEDNEPELLYG